MKSLWSRNTERRPEAFQLWDRVAERECWHEVSGDRSPDASWIRLERWNALCEEEQETFPPICPYFVIELRSRTDSLRQLQEKMQDYLRSGLRLGWLIDPKKQQRH